MTLNPKPPKVLPVEAAAGSAAAVAGTAAAVAAAGTPTACQGVALARGSASGFRASEGSRV